MSPLAIGSIACACIFVGALLGMFLRGVVPDNNLSQESKDVVRLGMGLIATMSALVLGLLTASAKTAFDTQNTEVKQAAAQILLLDRTLAHYGPETQEAREAVRRVVAFRLETTWPEESARASRLDTPETTPVVEDIEGRILRLEPQSDSQRWLRNRALQIATDLQQTRWLLFGGAAETVPFPFLVALIFWVTLIFASFGLYAPANATVVAVLFLAALSVATSIFLVLEMSGPFDGVIKISGTPLRYALSHLGA